MEIISIHRVSFFGIAHFLEEFYYPVKQTGSHKKCENLEHGGVPIPLNWSGYHYRMCFTEELGPVVQSIVSLTSSLRGQLVKCLTTL